MRQFVLIFLIVITAAGAFAADRQPALSKTPLSVEQMEVYKAFLSSYTNGSKSSHLNLANRTVMLDLSDTGNCLKGIKIESNDPAYSIVHEFDTQSALLANVTLVDSKEQMAKVKDNDPGRTMRQGQSVEHAVESAFASGLLTLSEVAFDKTHQYAVMNFSFVCGSLCGHGEVVILQKVDGHWKQTNRLCGGWIS